MFYFKLIFISIISIFIIISLYSCCLGARRYADLIEDSAQEFGVEASVVYAVAEVESHFNPKAKSKAGAIGIMQIMPETGRWIAGVLLIDDYQDEDLYRPEVNIRFGAYYLSYLFSIFEEDWQVYAAYNAGERAVKGWLEDKTFQKDAIPYDETAKYVFKVERAVRRYTKKNLLAFN